jgi:hypothetical protein
MAYRLQAQITAYNQHSLQIYSLQVTAPQVIALDHKYTDHNSQITAHRSQHIQVIAYRSQLIDHSAQIRLINHSYTDLNRTGHSAQVIAYKSAQLTDHSIDHSAQKVIAALVVYRS